MRQVALKPQYDLVIVGGGIQGCAMLWEAQSRGLDALLVEADDYCSQTSANSLKTIHGGIRYLQTLNLARTWRSAREQETLLKIAPHLVRPLPCLMPTERGLKRSRAAVATGFALYNLLKSRACNTRVLPAARCLSATQLARRTGLLDTTPVTGAGLWFDAQVQHAQRLGLAFIATARNAGADALNYMAAESVHKFGDTGLEIELEDRLNTRRYKVRADAVICCTAAGSAGLLSQSGILADEVPEFCLAVNMVINRAYSDHALGLKCGFASKDTHAPPRLLFAAPWRGNMLFGTWYFACTGEHGTVKPQREQVEQCLKEINATYPGAGFSTRDIGLVHAGLLPVSEKGARPEARLMDADTIHQPKPALELFTVIPSKYTTCRKVAEQAIDRLGVRMNKPVAHSCSSDTVLSGADGVEDYGAFLDQCQQQYRELFSHEIITQLVATYGNKIESIAGICRDEPQQAGLIPGTRDHVKAQLEYARESEQACTLTDFVCQRTYLASAGLPSMETLEYCAGIIGGADADAQIRRLHETSLFGQMIFDH